MTAATAALPYLYGRTAGLRVASQLPRGIGVIGHTIPSFFMVGIVLPLVLR